MKTLVVLAVLVLGLGYYYRDQIAPGWLGLERGAKVSVPSAMGGLGRSVGGAIGGAAKGF